MSSFSIYLKMCLRIGFYAHILVMPENASSFPFDVWRSEPEIKKTLYFFKQ